MTAHRISDRVGHKVLASILAGLFAASTRGGCSMRPTAIRFKIVLGSLLVVLVGAVAHSRELTFEERLAAEAAIERVYWSHRIWRAENPGTKPAFEDVVSDSRLFAQVGDYLKKSTALEVLWGRPVEAQQLQAEIDRMATQTQAPQILQELFSALGNQPEVIAETLGRRALVDRLVRSWYAFDTRFHFDVKQAAQSELAEIEGRECLGESSARYAETIWRLADTDGDIAASQGEVHLDGQEWETFIAAICREFSTDPATAEPLADRSTSQTSARDRLALLPTNQLTELWETTGSFEADIVIEVGDDFVKTGRFSWPKVSFESWWDSVAASIDHARATPGPYSLPPIATQACDDGSWKAILVSPAAPRERFTAVWTGEEMIVWGGDNRLDDGLNSGGRYRPATDTWLGTDGLGAPSARWDHTAVWTGSEMIVWGGEWGPRASTAAAGMTRRPTRGPRHRLSARPRRVLRTRRCGPAAR